MILTFSLTSKYLLVHYSIRRTKPTPNLLLIAYIWGKGTTELFIYLFIDLFFKNTSRFYCFSQISVSPFQHCPMLILELYLRKTMYFEEVSDLHELFFLIFHLHLTPYQNIAAFVAGQIPLQAVLFQHFLTGSSQLTFQSHQETERNESHHISNPRGAETASAFLLSHSIHHLLTAEPATIHLPTIPSLHWTKSQSARRVIDYY